MLAQDSGLRVQISLHPYVHETLVKSLPDQYVSIEETGFSVLGNDKSVCMHEWKEKSVL